MTHEAFYPGESFTFTRNGVEYIAEIEYDDFHGAPWEEYDGHGVVSDWTTRDKAPGELILACDGRHHRYYDFAESCRIARRDKWDARPFNSDGRETPRQQAAKAARADFEYLRSWCNDDWCYVGIIVRRANACKCCGASESLWGIESISGEYIRECAEEIAEELAFSSAA